MRTIPGSKVHAGTLTNTPNAATVAMVAALDVRNGLALAGRLSAVRAAMKGSPLVSFRGDLGPLQAFRGWAGPPAGLMPGSPMSLPMTGAPDPTTGAFSAMR